MKRQYKTLRGLFSKPERWTKKRYYRLDDGSEVDSSLDNATCFCLIGGVRFVYHTAAERNRVQRKLCAAITKLFGVTVRSITSWNDDYNRTIEDVQRVVREAKV